MHSPHCLQKMDGDGGKIDLAVGQTGDYHWIADQTLETSYPNMGNFYMVGIPEYNEYDSAAAEAYYYNGQSPAISGQ